MQETEKIWMNGELIDWADAKVHVGVHGLHYGSGVFEGIRCYDTPKGPAVFRLGEHLQRLHNSARLLHMEIPYSVDELRDATNELLGANGLDECYIRPIAFYGYGQLGVHARGNPVVRMGVRPTSYWLSNRFSMATNAVTLPNIIRLPNTSRTVARRSVNRFRSSSNCAAVTRS